MITIFTRMGTVEVATEYTSERRAQAKKKKDGLEGS